ncbi:PD-(D/E)XK nuclease family protein [Candidatus Daviesbacteria bacterium]|nr:PD-(D/E)XK nuclease family protein [Candidatus Daviesbacteria bacterium]
MAFNDIPRTRSFSLGDFHDFERCVFGFFVKHHLGKKYELEEGSQNMAIGSLLDLMIKKLHASSAYDQPLDYLQSNLLYAAEKEIREKVARAGKNSFYGALIPFLTNETLTLAQEVFTSYYQKRGGRFNHSITNKTFWEWLLKDDQILKIWGGPDAIELADDGLPEIVDYKYFGDSEMGKNNLDMDLMPKIYTLLCASELTQAGYEKARFRVRLWQEPLDESLYEEFDLSKAKNLEDYFKDKILRILRTQELSFCEKPYCRVCNSSQRQTWIKRLKELGFITG